MVEGGGFGNCGVFLAHNYVSEQFGNYVEYGILKHFYFFYTCHTYGTQFQRMSHISAATS